MLNKDYKEIVQLLLKNEVKFLVVGAYAMGAYGYPRATGDFDIWVETSSINGQRIYQSLAEFGAPLTEITETTFTEQGIVFQIGVAPRRIDIITKIDGVDFASAYKDKQEIEIEKMTVPFLSKKDLIKNKESTDRPQDQLDAEHLRNTPTS